MILQTCLAQTWILALDPALDPQAWPSQTTSNDGFGETLQPKLDDLLAQPDFGSHFYSSWLGG